MSEQDFGRGFKEDLEQHIREQVGDRIQRPKVMLVGDFRWGLIWGAIIVLVGAALLLDHLGVAPFDRLIQFWPLLLVLFGVMNILTQANRGFGILLIAAGTVLQLNRLGVMHLTFDQLWPLAIIAVGFLVMWGSLETRGFLRNKEKASGSTPAEDLPNTLSSVVVFGGTERTITSRSFRGGKAVAVLGGIELDFRDADIDGDEAQLEINCLFGGVEIRVPETWHVHSRGFPVFGGYTDKSRSTTVEGAAAKKKTLVITGVVLFGGIEIRN
jgi:predicted membrane protein